MVQRVVKVLVCTGIVFPLTLWAAPQPLISSHVVRDDTAKGKMATMFKSVVEEKLGDKYEIIIHSNSSLMNDEEVVDAVAGGTIPFAAPALSKFDRYTQQLKVFDLPFLFPDIDAANCFQKSPTGQTLLTRMESSGVLGLGYLHNGLKQLTATRPFSKPSELSGLRFRIIYSDVLKKQFEIIDVEPVPMAFSDVYQALADNRIQGQEKHLVEHLFQSFL
ncbi:TRAP transporter substrate-binding protein DctP [Marinobacter caseinilyticus]|uniref:TRAP transporter substrate-binding protein DctP n=1 Tax=Marinobacter caseinilyticus TaxID=2692195 RepID=UPI00249DFE2D|nr:TRAP transporter substrate-binding protein DctP [Marinobacter caseinilyticus]